MSKINLFYNTYKSDSVQRQRELDTCLVKNRIVFDRVIEVEGRPTFSELFAMSKDYPEDINCYCNSDIYFPDVSLLHKIKEGEFWVLSRYEFKKGILTHFNRADSFDSFVFRGVAKDMNVDFTMGMWGCLGGDTEILYKSNGTNKFTSLERLFKNLSYRWKDEEIKTLSLNEKNEMFYNDIMGVVESGIKPTIKITFNDKSSLTLTSDHKILIDIDNYVEAEKLNIGDWVIAKGSRKHITGRKKAPQRQVVPVLYHPSAYRNVVKGKTYWRLPKHRAVVEADMNNMTLEKYIYTLNSKDISGLVFLPSEMEVHHLDENSLNNELSNLLVLTKAAHAKLHYEMGSVPKREEIIKKQIINIESAGELMTYDVQMKRPYNNFVANGIVVHNCDNKIAYEATQSGYHVTNPSLSIKTIHLHEVDKRDHVRTPLNTVPPPYMTVPPTIIKNL